jgi:hypothetical protein
VADEHDLRGGQLREGGRERAAVVGDVASGVVAGVQRLDPELPAQALAVRGAAAEAPRRVGLTQPVDEDRDRTAGGDVAAQLQVQLQRLRQPVA